MGSKKDQHKVGIRSKPRGQQMGTAGVPDQNREVSRSPLNSSRPIGMIHKLTRTNILFLSGSVFVKPISFALMLVVFLLASGAFESVSAQARRTLVFVVSRSDPAEAQSSMDAVLMMEGGKLKVPYAEQSEASQKKFAAEYFKPGRTYRVTFGGGEVGSATVKDSSVGCNNIHARATVDHGGQIPQHLSGLATNSTSIGKRPSARRAPTPEERAAVMKLVDQTYRARRTPSGWLRNLKTTNLTATDLDGDGKFELIGSFVIETSAKQRRDLLLIAEPLAEGFKPAFVNFQAYKMQPEGFDSAIDFVDQLDVDGDGIAEVFTTQHGFDAYGYNIYKKVRGRWRLMLSTIGDAC